MDFQNLSGKLMVEIDTEENALPGGYCLLQCVGDFLRVPIFIYVLSIESIYRETK